MRQVRLLLIVLVALAIPALLALGVHFAAGGSLTAPPPVVARVSTAPIAAPSVEAAVTTTTKGSDRCAEPEHRSDPRCVGSTTVPTDDHSGRGSGSDDSSGSGKSGSGRSSSGHSGGDD